MSHMHSQTSGYHPFVASAPTGGALVLTLCAGVVIPLVPGLHVRLSQGARVARRDLQHESHDAPDAGNTLCGEVPVAVRHSSKFSPI